MSVTFWPNSNSIYKRHIMKIKLNIPYAHRHITLFVYNVPSWFIWVIVLFILLSEAWIRDLYHLLK